MYNIICIHTKRIGLHLSKNIDQNVIGKTTKQKLSGGVIKSLISKIGYTNFNKVLTKYFKTECQIPNKRIVLKNQPSNTLIV